LEGKLFLTHGSSSVGRASVSKTECREFESLDPCIKTKTKMKKFFKKVASYIKESYTELVHKVSWPTFSELTNSAIVVLTASLVIALAVFIVDSGFENIMTFIYKKVF
jgi:preprotein translocase subunit SecE